MKILGNKLFLFAFLSFFLSILSNKLNAGTKNTSIDYAQYRHQDCWIISPNCGDISFDATERYHKNPVYRGSPPLEWPVNGFYFNDPVSKNLYVYVSLYTRGYWPAQNTKVLRSRDNGNTWKDLGIVLDGSPDTFDGDGKTKGATLDISVVYADGKYHAAYGWAKPDNSDGGIAYAVADSPEGPFIRHSIPIHAEKSGQVYFNKYRRVYGSTLFKRKNDFLILSASSTPGNAGGTWALCALTTADPQGKWDGPDFLIYPQDKGRYLPSPIEFFPCFARGEYVYAIATSVARNRNYQVMFRAKLDEATKPSAWELVQEGSLWHSELLENETYGIWGQTISGFVDDYGIFNILFPSKDSKDQGTINIARRSFNNPMKDGGVISAPNESSITLLKKQFTSFSLTAQIEDHGQFSIVFAHNGPIGPDKPSGAENRFHHLMVSDCRELVVNESTVSLNQYDMTGNKSTLLTGKLPERRKGQSLELSLVQSSDMLNVRCSDNEVFTMLHNPKPGRIGLLVNKGGLLRVNKFIIDGKELPNKNWLLPTQGIIDAGVLSNELIKLEGSQYRYKFGYTSKADGFFVKWQFRGSEFGIASPKGNQLGRVKIFLDGDYLSEVNLNSSSEAPSSIVFQKSGLKEDKHVVAVEGVDKPPVCDSFYYR